MQIIFDTMCDTKVSPRVRVDAGKVLLDRSGIVAARPALEEDSMKTLAEKTSTDLEALVAQLESQIAEREAEAMMIEGEAIEIEDDEV